MTKPAHYSAMRLIELSMENYFNEASTLMTDMGKSITPSAYRSKRAAVKRQIQAMVITHATFSRYVYETFNRKDRPIPDDIINFNAVIKAKQIGVETRFEKLPRSI
jgi:hypothetical protein